MVLLSSSVGARVWLVLLVGPTDSEPEFAPSPWLRLLKVTASMIATTKTTMATQAPMISGRFLLDFLSDLAATGLVPAVTVLTGVAAGRAGVAVGCVAAGDAVDLAVAVAGLAADAAGFTGTAVGLDATVADLAVAVAGRAPFTATLVGAVAGLADAATGLVLAALTTGRPGVVALGF